MLCHFVRGDRTVQANKRNVSFAFMRPSKNINFDDNTKVVVHPSRAKMLPKTTRLGRSSSLGVGSGGNGTWSTFGRRLLRPKQMDFELALWLMLQLCVAPKRAYLQTAYRTETKDRWSRDDPAYFALLSLFLVASSTGYCVTFGRGFGKSVWIVVYVWLVDFVAIGATIATAGWLLSNRVLRKRSLPAHVTEQFVEWLYAFDVHCNAFFPLFLLLHVGQFLLSPVLLTKGFVATVISNALYALALSYYHYLTFLGYATLPFLERTEVFLYPVGLILLAVPFSILSKFNPAWYTISLYFGR